MNIFSTILQKLGIQKPAAPAAQAAPAPVQKPVAGAIPHNVMAVPDTAAPVPPPAKPAAMPMVDVMSKLNNLAGEKSGLDWKVSIVDLLKLLDMDSSLQARKELATELGCPANLMGGDYAEMNIWLHKTVLQKVADNGGNIPAELLKK
jgi:hypothetical protein